MKKLGTFRILSLETGHCAACFCRFQKIDLQQGSYHLDLCIDCQGTMDRLCGDDMSANELVGAMS